MNGKRSGAFEYNVTMEHARSSLRVAEMLLSNGKHGTLTGTNEKKCGIFGGRCRRIAVTLTETTHIARREAV
jgi:hypothetical protein